MSARVQTYPPRLPLKFIGSRGSYTVLVIRRNSVQKSGGFDKIAVLSHGANRIEPRRTAQHRNYLKNSNYHGAAPQDDANRKSAPQFGASHWKAAIFYLCQAT